MHDKIQIYNQAFELYFIAFWQLFVQFYNPFILYSILHFIITLQWLQAIVQYKGIQLVVSSYYLKTIWCLIIWFISSVCLYKLNYYIALTALRTQCFIQHVNLPRKISSRTKDFNVIIIFGQLMNIEEYVNLYFDFFANKNGVVIIKML